LILNLLRSWCKHIKYVGLKL